MPEIPLSRITNFARVVRPVYVLLDWQWVNDDESRSIPTTERIAKAITALIETLERDDEITSSTSGGLYAAKETGEDGETTINFGMEIPG